MAPSVEMTGQISHSKEMTGQISPRIEMTSCAGRGLQLRRGT
jgi:hypothetical protein